MAGWHVPLMLALLVLAYPSASAAAEEAAGKTSNLAPGALSVREGGSRGAVSGLLPQWNQPASERRCTAAALWRVKTTHTQLPPQSL